MSGRIKNLFFFFGLSTMAMVPDTVHWRPIALFLSAHLGSLRNDLSKYFYFPRSKFRIPHHFCSFI